MKKIFATTFCPVIICSLLLTIIGTVMAAAPDYERTSYPTQVIPTLDGKWTSPDEWTDGAETWIGTDIVFRSTWDGDMTRWIVEFLADTTNDPGDYLQFCIDPQQWGGSEPELGHHFMLMITGHTELTRYTVNNGEWYDWSGSSLEVEWATSLSTSSDSSTPHWIYEFQIDRGTANLSWGDPWNFLLGAFDASNPGNGFQSWPPTDPDVPDQYGVENYSVEPIPEGLTFAVMALLTTVSMLIGYKYFLKRKEKKTQ